MSYSRWGGRGSGHWYTYWHYRAEGETKDNALFHICGVATIEAKELRDDIESCISVVSKKDGCSDKVKLDELKKYMLEFLSDVDDDYKQKP